MYRGVRYVSNPRSLPSLVDSGVVNPAQWAQCPTCGRAWDDSKSTALTPTPSGRCPFEHWHRSSRGDFSPADRAAIATSDTPESTAAWLRGGSPLPPSLPLQGKLESAIIDAIAKLGGYIDDEASSKLDELAEHIACHPKSRINR